MNKPMFFCTSENRVSDVYMGDMNYSVDDIHTYLPALLMHRWEMLYARDVGPIHISERIISSK
jgi:hypothetical protein